MHSRLGLFLSLTKMCQLASSTIYLQCSVCEVHDNSARRPEPGLERGDTRELVSLAHLHVGSGLEQVLLHVVHEVVEQLDFLLDGRRELLHAVVVLLALVVDVVNVPKMTDSKLFQYVDLYLPKQA